MKQLIVALSLSCGIVPAMAQTAPATVVPVPAAQTAGANALPADTQALTKPAAKPARGKSAEYRISPEDTLTVTCLNAPEYNVSATVLPDGTISFPKMGQIAVVGKTLKQVEAQITKFLKTEFVRPQVSVGVRERQVRQVAVIGTGVKTTGKRVIRDGWTVRDAIADAGGLVSDRTDLFTATLTRFETAERIPLDLVAIFGENSGEANLLLEPNDQIVVDAAEESKSQVQVSGEVLRPGFVVIPRDRTISKALDSAGGPKPTALLSEVIVERNGEKFPVSLIELVKNGTEPALRLLPGDKLVVPENKRLVYIMGAAGRQGAMLLPDDRQMTLLKVMADSGVQFNQAEVKKTQIIRDDAQGKPQVTEVNVEAMYKKADYSKDVALLPGDIVFVPYKGSKRFGLTDFVNSAFGIVQARSLFSPDFWRF